jgi:hypothetical protein
MSVASMKLVICFKISASPDWEGYGQLLTDTMLVPPMWMSACLSAGVAATVAPISLACVRDLTTSHVAMA